MRAGTGLILGLLLAAAAPAWAQDDGYGYRFSEGGDSGLSNYAGLRGSFAFSGTTSTNVPSTPPTALRASYNTGGGGSIYLGTRLPYGLRLELEALYRYLPYNQVDMNGIKSVAHGQAHIGAPMVNLLWDIPVSSFPFRPFIGAGIGGAYTDIALRDVTDTDTFLNSSKWGLAYQFMGGAEVPLSQSSRFTAMYRWLKVDGARGACGISGPATSTCSTDLGTQSIDLGLEMDL